MSKRTYICLDCRTAKRAEAAYGLNTDFGCSQCRGELFELPWRWRIPKRSDDIGWKRLRKMVADLKRSRLPLRRAEGERLLTKLDAQIEATLRRKDSEAKETKLKYLRWRRREIKRKYPEQAPGSIAILTVSK